MPMCAAYNFRFYIFIIFITFIVCQSRPTHTCTLVLTAEIGGDGCLLLRHSFTACPQLLKVNHNFFLDFHRSSLLHGQNSNNS